MTLGPIEVLVIAFPGSQFNGRIIPELEAVVANNTINVVDGLLIHKTDDGEVSIIEFEDLELDEGLTALRGLVGETVLDLVSAEDVDEFAAGVEPGSSAAVLVFEHTWFKPLRDAIVDSGGILVADLRVPGAVVDEVLDSLATV